MIINTKKELKFYIAADRMMNRGVFRYSVLYYIKCIFFPDFIMLYLSSMRKCSYYKRKGIWAFPLYFFHFLRYRRLGFKLGFSIGMDIFGYGLVIPHYGTIVVGRTNNIGNYAALHTSTCISGNGKEIGEGLYLSTGAKITAKIKLQNNVTVGANSVVNKTVYGNNIMLAGTPAIVKKNMEPWYFLDDIYRVRFEKVEKMKCQFF